jgi:DNA/RNA endonuclease YhcR with UshA esterase domain
MKKNYVFLLWLLLFLIGQSQHLLISEIYIQPSVNDTAEFIEIYNPGTSPVALDNYYLADYPTYYEVVNGINPASSFDFNLRFPAGTQIQPGSVMTIALTASAFRQEFGQDPDFEVFNTSSTVPDMQLISSNTSQAPLLGNLREMVILYTWDGSSDLVQDVDYVTWGSASSTSKVDKSGISIDGPDADATASAYASDTDINLQKSLTVTAGKSYVRDDDQESGEVTTGGNGIGGHDETSEDLSTSFIEINNPTPGVFGLGSAFSGSGLASIDPVTVEQNQTVSFSITFKGEYPDPLTTVAILFPAEFTLTGAVQDVQLQGAGFQNATVEFRNDTLVILNAGITLSDSGTVVIRNITAPSALGTYTVEVFSAVNAEPLQPMASVLTVTVVEAPTPIAVIQQNESQYLNQTVRIRGYVVLGAGKTTTAWTDAYIADETGAGINIYRSGSVDPDLVRGNYVEIVGTVDNFGGVTEIVNYTVTVLAQNQPLPEPIPFSTGDANNLQYEGYWVQVEGEVTDYAANIGGGTNITIDDGSGPLTIRVWDATGVNTSFFSVGDTIVVNGPIDVYQNNAQLLVAYQEDIRFKNQKFSLADGSGIVTLDVSSIGKDSAGVSMNLTVEGNVPDTIATLQIWLPVYWQWDSLSNPVQLTGDVFSSASITIVRDPFEPSPMLLIEGASIGLGQSGTIRISGLTTPDKDITSTVFVQTAGSEGTLTFVKTSPAILVGTGRITPIRDVQLNMAQFSGSTLTIRGEVTIGAGVIRTDRTSAYVQDSSWYGINVNQQALDTTNLKRHYLVEITGTISEYQNVTQITPQTIQVLDQNSAFVVPFEITTAEANSGRWDGTLIKTYGVVIDFYSTNTTAGDYNVRITDGTKPFMVRIWGTTKIDLSGIEQGKTAIWATGVGSIFREEYQMLPGYQDQIEIDENYAPSLKLVALDIPPHPFVPDMGEKLVIKVNAGAPATHIILRIFDLAGREIITLMDASVEEVFITKSWDGRDTYHNLVPLGTYICQLEIIDPLTGKRKFKRAPIVVGTILK